MRFFKRLALSLVVISFILGNPGLTSAANPPRITSGLADEPIISSDGVHIQGVRAIIKVPSGKINDVKEVTVTVTTPDVTTGAVGTLSWGRLGGFTEEVGVGTGDEYVNLIPTDINNPDTTSQYIWTKATKTLEVIFRYTLNDIYGSTFDNDFNIHLRTTGPVALQNLLMQPALANSDLLIDSSFDTNSPPDVEPIPDVEVEVTEVIPAEVDVTVVATDVDADPIEYALLSAPAGGELIDDTYVWGPTIEDVGTQNVQIVATDPYGVTTTDFNVTVQTPPIPQTGSWTATNSNDAPIARVGHNIVWDGQDRTFVWGGTLADGTHTGSGAYYSVSADAWTAMPDTLNGHATSDGVAVWTGSKLLVWGGLTDAGVATNEGQVYDPVTNSWTPMSTTNAPTARYDATAVWTGSKLFVWGGAQVSGATFSWLNNGAVYDPATDTWSSVSVSGLEARQGAAATTVVTDSKVAVWGGSSWSEATGNIYYQDGGIYDVANDAWTIIDSSSGPPVGRVQHALVRASDDAFIVWGGQSATGSLNVGSLYTLSTNSWSDLNITNAPSSRTGFAYGGDNGTLVIWGGNDGVDVVATGGVYNLATSTWLATSTITAPNARQNSEGVWTGSGMFVWGGSGIGAALENTGGIFTP